LQAQTTGVIKAFEGSENFYRDFVPVERVIDVQTAFVWRDIAASGIWNIGTGEVKSFQAVAEETAKKYNARIETVPFPKHLEYSYQKYTCADLTKLKSTLDVF
jgi:ADP-L-glycero-D-manno-heptose 6-epimerase